MNLPPSNGLLASTAQLVEFLTIWTTFLPPTSTRPGECFTEGELETLAPFQYLSCWQTDIGSIKMEERMYLSMLSKIIW